jgi:hypothetical protein
VCLAALAFVMAVSQPGQGRAEAQQVAQDPAALEAAYERLFAEMLRDPTNLDIMFRYADVATKLENYEAAIGALERMLLINPNLPRVKLELGVLYYRLGSYPIARRYFQGAVAGDNVPPEVRAKVDTFLARIADAESPHSLTAWVTLGLRYQSNANAAPADDQVKALGFDATLDDASLEDDDVNLFGQVRVRHAYDLDEAGRTYWETNFQVYYAKQFELDELDLGYLELTTGPSFVLVADENGALRARPFALGNFVTLDDREHFGTLGGGVELVKPFGREVLTGAGYVYRHKKFFDTDAKPNNHEFTSDEHTLRASARYLPVPWLSLGAYGEYAFEDANAGFNSNEEWLAGGSVSFEYGAPVGPAMLPWSTSFTVEYVETDYDDPDPSVAPMVSRLDEEWRFTVSTTMTLAKDLYATVLGRYTDNDSNLPNYRYDNWLGQVSVTKRF